MQEAEEAREEHERNRWYALQQEQQQMRLAFQRDSESTRLLMGHLFHATGIEQPPVLAPLAFSVPPAHLIEPSRLLRNDSAEVEPDKTAYLRTEETPNQTTDHRTEETVEHNSSEQEQSDNIASVSVTSDTDPSDVDQRLSSKAAASIDTVLPNPLIEPSGLLRNDSAEVESGKTANLRTEETPNQTADHRIEEAAEHNSSE